VKLHLSCDRYEGEILPVDAKKSTALNQKIKADQEEAERKRKEDAFEKELIDRCLHLEMNNKREAFESPNKVEECMEAPEGESDGPPTPPPEEVEVTREGQAEEKKEEEQKEEKKVEDTGPKPK
jgi:hypothetical protein